MIVGTPQRTNSATVWLPMYPAPPMTSTGPVRPEGAGVPPVEEEEALMRSVWGRA
jgi:hypothetical protein